MRSSKARRFNRNIRLAALLGCVCLWFGAPTQAAEKSPDWVLVTDAAAWQPRDSQGEVAYRDRLWIFGGWFNSFEAPPRDVWSSPDGITWNRDKAQAPWKHSDLSMSTVFKDKMWFMGGWYNGRLPGHSAGNEVWSSTNGADWTAATKNPGWTPRLAAGIVVFNDRMWVLGGTENYYFGDQTSLKNDVWSTADGKHWEQATASAQWSPRAYHQAVVLGGKMYVFGGGNYVPEYQALNDVWSSEDGVHWKQVTESAPWSPRLWFSAVVFRDHMWVLGGWSNDPARNWGDVWYSKDGRNWQSLHSETIWKPRHEHSAVCMQDKIWVVGGHAKPLSNEVWSLELPPDWPQEDPPE